MKFLKELSDLNEGTLVLTSTERVARHLRLQSALLQSMSGKKAWFNKGRIQTVTSWIENAWLELMPAEQLLYPVQELAVVKGLADSSGLMPATLISSTATSRRIGSAYSEALKYQIPMDQERFRFKRELEVFWQLQEMLRRECSSQGVVFRAQLPGLLLKAVQEGLVELPSKIVIVGILDMNPAEKVLFQAIAARGVEVEEVDVAGDRSTPQLIRATNQGDEFTLVAEWVNNHLSPYVDTPLAAPQLAILVPDIRNFQAPLIEALSLHCSPATLIPGESDADMRTPWDISSGATLGSRPLVRAAMDLLSITPQEADSEAFSRVLRSPWIGGETSEGRARALLDIWLRDNMGLSMGGEDFLRAIGVYKGDAVPDFRERFAGYLAAHLNGAAKRYPSEWAEQFSQALVGMGWPGGKELDSANFQTMKAWDEALTLFRTLDTQLGRVEYPRAYMWLREIIDTRQFQPRISHVAPVSILGYEDAIGLHFDAVWVLGASSTVLPARVEPSPFLPLELQVAAGIPGASSEGALARAEKVVAALLSTSADVTVSCPGHNDKGASVSCSELFGSWPAAAPSVHSHGLFVDQLLGILDRSQVVPETVAPVSADELAWIKGGVRIFKDYAEAPFLSFARNRLRAEMFPEPVIGLDPRIQGTMVHLVLELFWTDVRTSKALKAMSHGQLFDKIRDTVSKASEQLLNKLVWRYGKRVIALERLRLESLINDWLYLESKRTHDFEVLGFEEPHDIAVGLVNITVKVDRRDRIFLTEDESEFRDVVIDYKSGASMRMTSLNADTLTEPQLPIYATKIDFQQNGGKRIDGIALAQVNSKSLGFHTRSNFTGELAPRTGKHSGVDTEGAWDGQCEAWTNALDKMSQGFIDGEAWLQNGAPLPMGYEYLGILTR
ncbi:PD-(D/E)XK nuclease family protein [Pseudomonas aeruginosa]|uniref:PD-(D/E)XK nuclease family protein n=1 Tax=Pseudomonas aeruginosa TaxID=287 RepID=UPI001959DD0F|nr:PD-(D/E)XK nuclease family protein [Pseudomonas aeruginosa]MBM7166343.1 PD-(D/E)XK nuclease family protein [Pseudomonas aeruginosa]